MQMRRIAAAALCLLAAACSSDCDADQQRSFLRSWTDNLYLWYREVPAVDPSQYPDPIKYFAQLRTPLTTPSGKDKDNFHFVIATDAWRALSQSGVTAGYGVTWAVLAPKVPRNVVAAYNEPGSPAVTNNVNRGVKVLVVDGVDLVNAPDVDKLNAGLFPAKAGEPHTFTVQDPGGATRSVTMTSQNITGTPVQSVTALDTPTGKVGYMLFNDHVAPAEQELIDAVNQLTSSGVVDLVLDIRYNGGGYLSIASELAYMIAGPARTTNKTFERITFNDKHPSTDPVTGQPLTPTPFLSTTQGLSTASGRPLPFLNLPRLFVITGSGTCSASESVINSLAGVDVQIVQIGAVTCGKPYGFYPQDLCGTTYFSIEFQGVNEKGFGDYADGFTPGATTTAGFPGCRVDDDFTHALGDPQEGRLAAALAYRSSPGCAGPIRGALTSSDLRGEGRVFKSPWHENRIMR
jgi:hypothetical protein